MEDLGAKIRVMRRYNTGNYTHIELEMEVNGAYQKLVDNPKLADGLIAGSTNMGKSMDTVLQEVLANYNAKFNQQEPQ